MAAAKAGPPPPLDRRSSPAAVSPIVVDEARGSAGVSSDGSPSHSDDSGVEEPSAGGHDTVSPAGGGGEGAVRDLIRELQRRLPVLSISQLQQVALCGEALQRPPSTCLAAAGRELALRLSTRHGGGGGGGGEELDLGYGSSDRVTVTGRYRLPISRHIWSITMMLQALGRQGLVDPGLLECASIFIAGRTSKEADYLQRTLDWIKKR
jgi:hypothetical protein